MRPLADLEGLSAPAHDLISFTGDPQSGTKIKTGPASRNGSRTVSIALARLEFSRPA